MIFHPHFLESYVKEAAMSYHPTDVDSEGNWPLQNDALESNHWCQLMTFSASSPASCSSYQKHSLDFLAKE